MIKPYGSIGLGEKFQDDVRNHWGAIPFEDIILGVNYVLNNYEFLDKTRIYHVGASFGGYIYWIEGRLCQ